MTARSIDFHPFDLEGTEEICAYRRETMAVHIGGRPWRGLEGDWMDSVIDTFLATGSARARWHDAHNY